MMKLWKIFLEMICAVVLMTLILTSCSVTEPNKETPDLTSNNVSTITEDEAINLVRAKMGEDFYYIPSEKLEEKDGNQYYVVYVKKPLDADNMTTIATYMVKTDGSELFDKYVASYIGEYVRTSAAGEETFVVSEDGTFEMTITGEKKQVVSGLYKLGITASADVVKLLCYPKMNVIDGKEEIVENVQGTAVIEDGKLTLSMECADTVFTKK